MKKVFLVLLTFVLLCSCSKKINYTYDINSRNVDMSSYEGLSATNHMFKAITVQELFNVIDNKSSGVFYLGRTNCSCCQITVKYLNEVALVYNVPVYYIDVYDEQMPINDELKDKLTIYLYDIVAEIDGEKQLQTPTIFSVINGEITNSLICLSNWDWNPTPTKKQEEKLLKKYKEIITPFAE